MLKLRYTFQVLNILGKTYSTYFGKTKIISIVTIKISFGITGCGGCVRPIDNLNDPIVLHLAKSAVSEYNKKAKTHIHFVSVINGQAATLNYMLVISAKDDNDTVVHQKNYLAYVFFRPWLKKNRFTLLSFDQIHG